MTVTEAKKLTPGIYELTFTNQQTDLAVIGVDVGGPWYAYVSGDGAYDGAKSWKLVSNVRPVITSSPRLPE